MTTANAARTAAARSSGTSSSNVRGWRGPNDEQHDDHQRRSRRSSSSRRSTRATTATPIVSSVTYDGPRGRARRRRCGRHRAGRSETGSAPWPAARTRRRTPSDACSASSRRAIVPQSSYAASLNSSGSPSSACREVRSGCGTTCDIATPMNERRHRDQEPGDRAGDADVEQHPLGRNRLADPDERAERAGQRAAATGGKTAGDASTS